MNKIDMRAESLDAALANAPVSLDMARKLACGFARSQPELAITRLPVALATGRILAEDIVAEAEQPRFDAAEVDGYAISTDDLQGDGPWKLRITGNLEAGSEPQERVAYRTDEALRIAAGAPVPTFANAVIPKHSVSRIDRTLELSTRPEAFANIFRAGTHVASGARLMDRETVLSPRHLGLLSSMGVTDVTTFRKLPVAVLSTGSELVEPGDKLPPAGTHDANRQMLISAITERWVRVRDLGIVGDDTALLRMVMGEAVASQRVILTTGGTGPGESDQIARIIEDLGGELLVESIAMQAGGTTMIGAVDKTLIISLPGDPVAAWIGFETLVRPTLRAAVGLLEGELETASGRALFAYPKERGVTDLPLVTAGGADDKGDAPLFLSRERPTGNLALLAKSDGFALLDEAQGPVAAGDPVQWVRFDRG
ncbi:MAG: molybdopterin molybdotransferase MoeA [Pseudomonadota bacterium]